MPSSERLGLSLIWNIGGGRLFPQLSNLKCKQSHDERYDHENSLGLGPAGCVIIHEVANIVDCRSQVWNRDCELVDAYDPTPGNVARACPAVRAWIRVALRSETDLIVGTAR